MLTLENKEQYLDNSGSMEQFLDLNYLKEKIYFDYNIKIKDNPNYTILHSLFFWINKNLSYAKDENFRAKNKFMRSAKEIWESGLATGCTDYAIVFATLARQLQIPTTLLHTMSENFINNIKNENKKYTGHAFCECFVNGEWILIDPANGKYIGVYNKKRIILQYKINNESVFIPCDRNVGFGKQTIKEFNHKMEELCLGVNIM